MYSNPSKEPVRWTLVNLQIALAGLLGGSGTFLAIVIFRVASGAAPEIGADMAILVHMAIAAAVAASLVQLVFAPLSFAGARRRFLRQAAHVHGGPEAGGDDARQHLWERFSTTTIISAAILEGAAFLSLVTYLMTHSAVALALAIVLMMGIATTIPTRSRVDRWLNEQIRLIGQEKLFG